MTNKTTMATGARNLITDVPGVVVGNASDDFIKTGCTVITADKPFVAAVDVMGGAPGTRETDCLDPERLVSDVDALVLAGGSAFGLDAASGVCDALRAEGKGFTVGPMNVPIVPSAIIFDLLNGGQKDWTVNPYRKLGVEALANAEQVFELGSVGAGFGATCATLKGGLGSTSLVLPSGYTVGALVVANPHGSAVVPGTKQFWAAPFEVQNEFGGFGVANSHDPLQIPINKKMAAYEAIGNTTLVVVATDATLDKAQARRLAVAAQDGIARALVPAHTQYDGDLVFSMSTRSKPLSSPDDLVDLGHAAAVCVSRAIARAVFSAGSQSTDILPSWQKQFDQA